MIWLTSWMMSNFLEEAVAAAWFHTKVYK
ncbi:hypothetical protein NC653_036009 [Populus alba x Populus x berolinensis]|uniref:Uncharacterized protein n=1 Tax=Populus alba x Populus x berolinensis TaxID=444605 RepID=A0AAD6PUD2_9ROSI|nr:hypothetical protein NC653_036009 [Populus alba x Populus x berolinensis]